MSYSQNPERFNKIYRYLHPNWAGWRVIEEQKKRPRFPANLKERRQLLEDLEYSFWHEKKTDDANI